MRGNWNFRTPPSSAAAIWTEPAIRTTTASPPSWPAIWRSRFSMAVTDSGASRHFSSPYTMRGAICSTPPPTPGRSRPFRSTRRRNATYYLLVQGNAFTACRLHGPGHRHLSHPDHGGAGCGRAETGRDLRGRRHLAEERSPERISWRSFRETAPRWNPVNLFSVNLETGSGDSEISNWVGPEDPKDLCALRVESSGTLQLPR